MKVPFLDLTTQYKQIAGELEPALLGVSSSGRYILGEEGERFEAEFARFTGAKHAVAVSNGLDALRLALMVKGVGPGDEVILPASTFIATALAVSSLGATPVLVDCDENTANMEADAVERAITPRTKVLMPVHLYGLCTEMAGLEKLAAERGLTILEDACQAHGAAIGARQAGSMGELACFSFYPGKNLGAMGDAGCITTSSDELAGKLRRLRNYGQERKYYHVDVGYNHRLDEIQAAVLRVKLRHLPAWNEARRSHAAAYSRGLEGLPLGLPRTPRDFTHVFHLYVVSTPRRDALMKHLEERGVSSLIHYPVPIHLQQAYASLGQGTGSFPVAEKRAREILSLPMFPELAAEQIEAVIAAVRDFFRA